MVINPVRLKLPTSVIATARVNGANLYIGKKIDPELFQAVYRTEITQPTLTEEKALYVGLHSSSKLPSIHDLLLRRLRA